MSILRRFSRSEIVVIAVIVVILILLLVPEVQVPYNAGNCERISAALKKISIALCDQERNAEYTEYFVPGGGKGQFDSGSLFERFGLTQRWKIDEDFVEFQFYPLAVSEKLVIRGYKPSILLVMVPIREADKETLPNLYECVNLSPEDAMKCQLQVISKLLESMKEYDVAGLRSDGSVRFLSDDELASAGIHVNRQD